MRYARAACARTTRGEENWRGAAGKRGTTRDAVLLKIASAQKRKREREEFILSPSLLLSFSNISRKIARLSSVNIDDKTSKDRATRAFILIQQLLYTSNKKIIRAEMRHYIEIISSSERNKPSEGANFFFFRTRDSTNMSEYWITITESNSARTICLIIRRVPLDLETTRD